MYYYHHVNIIKIYEVKYYNNMVLSLSFNDIKSAKYFAEKVLKLNSKSIYYNVSYLFLYTLENKMSVINNNSFLENLTKNEKNI
jgi:hypothetical protein